MWGACRGFCMWLCVYDYISDCVERFVTLCVYSCVWLCCYGCEALGIEPRASQRFSLMLPLVCSLLSWCVCSAALVAPLLFHGF